MSTAEQLVGLVSWLRDDETRIALTSAIHLLVEESERRIADLESQLVQANGTIAGLHTRIADLEQAV